jgi:hypothetical protein
MNEGAKSIALFPLLARSHHMDCTNCESMLDTCTCKVAYILVPCCTPNNLIDRFNDVAGSSSSPFLSSKEGGLTDAYSISLGKVMINARGIGLGVFLLIRLIMQ